MRKRETTRGKLARLFGGSWTYDRYSGAQWNCDDNERYVARVHTGGFDVCGEPMPGSSLIMYSRKGSPPVFVYMAEFEFNQRLGVTGDGNG